MDQAASSLTVAEPHKAKAARDHSMAPSHVRRPLRSLIEAKFGRHGAWQYSLNSRII